MAKMTCSISGLELKIPHMAMTLPAGYSAHPIFYLPQKQLLGIYRNYLKGRLTDIDSYLLFLALIHSTDAVSFQHPAHYRKGTTDKIIANNIDRLVTVIWQSDIIQHPSFKQPSYRVSAENYNQFLIGITEWLNLWEANIDTFKKGRVFAVRRRQLETVEKKLEKIILSGFEGTVLANSVATWADKAAEFPSDTAEQWKGIIRKCYNSEAMFNTPKSTLEEIRDYCQQNILAGSIHFHSLMKVLNGGIARHRSYLGLDTIDTFSNISSTYTLLTEDVNVQDKALIDILSKAPTEPPVRNNYPSQIAFIRAKLNYKVYLQHQKATPPATPATDSSDTSILEPSATKTIEVE